MKPYDPATGETREITYTVDPAVLERYALPETDADFTMPDSPMAERRASDTTVTDTSVAPFNRLGVLYAGYFPQGTAFMIAPDVLVTAAHCVYENGAFAQNVSYVPGYINGTEPYGSYAVTYMAIPVAYQNIPGPSNDWAVLYVGTDLTKQGIGGYFNFAVSPSSDGTAVRFAGYGSTDENSPPYQSYSDSTTSYPLLYPGRVRVSPCNPQHGKSAGPVYVTSGGQHKTYTIVTICSQSASSSAIDGPKLTAGIIAVFEAELQASLNRNN